MNFSVKNLITKIGLTLQSIVNREQKANSDITEGTGRLLLQMRGLQSEQ